MPDTTLTVRRSDRHAFGALLAAIVLLGCVSRPVPTPTRPLGPGEAWLPIANWTLPDGSTLLCAGGGFVGDIRLRGAANDPRLAWMVYPDGSRTELSWPVGYSARFVPRLEVLDGAGRVVGRDGSLVTGGCSTQEPGVMYVELENRRLPT
jgi:hypothetical protein